MIRAVLFDLDDTLLRLNLTAFLTRYVAGASRLLASAARTSPVALGVPYVRAFLAMDAQDRQDSLTNERLFNQTILESTGIPLDDPVIADLMTYYEEEIVPGFSGGIVSARPVEGARAAIEAVHDAGLVCALATNPTFSLACDRARMELGGRARGGLRSGVDHGRTPRGASRAPATTRSLPTPLGVRLEECLMVGNDATRDIVARRLRPAGRPTSGYARPQATPSGAGPMAAPRPRAARARQAPERRRTR